MTHGHGEEENFVNWNALGLLAFHLGSILELNFLHNKTAVGPLVVTGIFCLSLTGCLPTPKVSGEPSPSGQWSGSMLVLRIAHPGPHLKDTFISGSSSIVPCPADH